MSAMALLEEVYLRKRNDELISPDVQVLPKCACNFVNLNRKDETRSDASGLARTLGAT